MIIYFRLLYNTSTVLNKVTSLLSIVYLVFATVNCCTHTVRLRMRISVTTPTSRWTKKELWCISK